MAAVPVRESLASLVDTWERRGRDIAIVAPRGLRSIRTSYAGLAALARRFAAELEMRDVRPGERVLLWGANSADWVATFFGCVLRGVLPVPLDAAGAPEFARRVRDEVSPRLILVGQEQSRSSAFGASSATPIIELEELSQNISTGQAQALRTLKPDAPLQIIFTSGTTGEPKGVVHTHRNVLSTLAPIEAEMQKYLKYERLFHPIRFLHTLPLSHVFGQFMGLWVPPLLAAEVHFQDRLVAGELFEQIKRERISVLAAVPRVLDLMQAETVGRFPALSWQIAQDKNLRAVRRWWRFRDVHRRLGLKFWAFVCGGASLSPSGEQFWNALGFVVVQGYGMTETTALVTLNHPFRPVQGTIGKVLPGREVKLGDDGEVLVRGETISQLSWQHGQLTGSEEEWLRTGDLGEFDDGGNLRFRGRKKDVIVTAAGLNIHPEDLEAALSKQPGIRSAAVIENDFGNGPEAVAALVSEPASQAEQAVFAANAELADFQRVRHWLVWPEPDLPRTSTGKVLRREVARRIATGEVTLQASQHGADRALELDSLARVELQSELEQRYGVLLDDAAVQKVKSSEDLRRLVARSGNAQTAGPTRERKHFYLRWPWHPLQQAIRTAFIELIARPLVWLLAKPSVRRLSKLDSASPMLIVANHITSYDAAFVLYALPRRIRRRVAIAMSGELLLDMRRARNQGNWLADLLAPVGYFLITALFNVFPLPQRTGFRQSFRHAGEAVERGYSVLVFPEGKRSDDGTPLPLQSGAGLLWRDLGVSALPVYLAGLGQIKATGASWFRSGKIHVVVGDRLRLKPNRSPEQLTAELRRALFGTLSDGE